MLSQELIDHSTEVGDNIASKPLSVKKASLQALKELKKSVQSRRFQLDTPLIEIVSRFSVEGIDWNVLIGKIIDLHRETNPRSVRVFRRETAYKKGNLILPSSENGFFYVLDSDYDAYAEYVSCDKYSLDISDKGELPEIKVGALVEAGLTIRPKTLVGSRIFPSTIIFNKEMITERNLYRFKLANSLLKFTVLVVNNIKQRKVSN